jgi:predicted Zn-dependent protease
VRLYWADASLKNANYKNAAEQYEWLRQKQPDNIVVLNNLAWSYQQLNDPRALEIAERAYKLKPENPAVGDTLGWMLVEQGKTARGLELLQQAVAAAPKASEIRYHLAQAWLKSGDKAKARDELERLLSNDANFPRQSEALALLKKLRN